MNASSLVRIPFHGDTIEAIQVGPRDVRVAISRICNSLGLDSFTQIRALKTTHSHWSGTSMIPVPDERGRSQEHAMIPLGRLPMWLVNIKASKVAPELRGKIKLYQCEAADVLERHFFGGPSATLSDPFALMADQFRRIADRQAAIEARVAAVEFRQDTRHPLAIEALEQIARITQPPIRKERPRPSLDACGRWLRETLQGGPVRLADIRSRCIAKGISPKTLYAAREKVQIAAFRKGGSIWWEDASGAKIRG